MALRAINNSIRSVVNLGARINTKYLSTSNRAVYRSQGDTEETALAFLKDENYSYQKKNQFFRFCCKEFSPENYIAYVCIFRYEKEPDAPKKLFIYDAFIRGLNNKEYLNPFEKETEGLIKEINLSNLNKRAIDDRMNAGTPPDLFETARTDVACNLLDTVARFQQCGSNAFLKEATPEVVKGILRLKQLLNTYGFKDTTTMGIY